MVKDGLPNLMKDLRTLVQSHLPALSGRHRHARRGFSILTVLLSLTLLASILVGFASVVQNRTSRVAREVQAAQGELSAEAGIALIVASLLENAAHEESHRRPADGTPYACTLDNGTQLFMAAQDVAGRIDLNTASQDLLLALFDKQADPEKSAALISAIESRRRNDGFRMVQEFAQLPGVDRDLYAHIAPDLTVYSKRPSLDEASARQALRTRLARTGIAKDIAYASSADGLKFEIDVIARTAPGRGYRATAAVEIRPGHMPAYHILFWNGQPFRSESLPPPYDGWLAGAGERQVSSCTSS